jgi:hypothetical protein
MITVMQDIVVKIQTAIPGKAGHYIFTGGPGTDSIMLGFRHTLKPNDLDVARISKPVHKVCPCNADAGYSYLQCRHPQKPANTIKRLTITRTKGISSGARANIAKLPSKKKVQMPGAARAGIGLLILGAIVVGLGQYFERDAFSLYGLAMAVGGFVLYMAASIVAKRRAR